MEGGYLDQKLHMIILAPAYTSSRITSFICILKLIMQKLYSCNRYQTMEIGNFSDKSLVRNMVDLALRKSIN